MPGSHANIQPMTDSLAELKNIGPTTIRQLKEVGIETAAQLRRIGTVGAYRRLKHAFPREVTANMLYALEGALQDCPWNRLPTETRERLRREAGG